ncbi:hypothetical protein BKH31_02895 [Actinomyces oris]|uniref:Uncharacterized protein n=1 Tax=Actinomyces oris TaxID=544580 RepID=A0A1Q8VJC3_9ACTO|nr:hypothetical protein [Actinomyces oris]OLO48193.1 hypothetical protein BKH31_02895 [Actinomyces oris]
MTWTKDVDVSTSAGLAAALDAVEASPEAWDSPLGHQVAKEIVRLVPMRVGPGRVASLVASGGVSWDEVVADLAAEALEMLLMRRDLRAGGSDLWAVLVNHSVWMVQGRQERERQHGLSGDSAHPHRMRERVSCSALDIADLAAGTGFTPPGAVEVERRRVWVRDEDLGPCLGEVVEALVWASVPACTARAGTCRVAELAASTRPRERHRSARQDAGEGVLASLGISPDAAGAWMSLIAGSRRGGLESALVWSLRERIATGLVAGDLVWDEFLTASQRRWLKTVVSGVVVQAPVAPAPARRAPVCHLDGPGVQLTLFPVEEVGAGAAA